MDSLQGLLEGECGGSNPLLQLKTHFANESLQHDLVNSYSQQSEDLAQKSSASKDDYSLSGLFGNRLPMVTAPATFDMASLLNEMKQVEVITPLQHHHPPMVHKPQEIQIMPSTVQHSLLAHKWLDEIDTEKFKPSTTNVPSAPLSDWPTNLQSNFYNCGFTRFAPRWPTSYEAVSFQKGDDWLDGFAKGESSGFLDEHNHEYSKVQEASLVNQEETSNNIIKEPTEDDKEFWDRAEREWSDITNSWNDTPWGQEYLDEMNASREYAFKKENPMLEHPDALQEGIRRLEAGDVSNAVLFLEAAVQKEPENPEAWFYLGRSQADNEQEIPAIIAFEKCLDLDANNLKALMSLAVCFTNEGHTYKAVESLFKWLKSNPKYSEIASNKILEDYKVSMNAISSHDDLVKLFLQAARSSPEEIDPDLQDGLGVLFNLSSDFDKAADCFRTALHVQPENSILWNKLGATLANGNRSEEALEAYHRALSLRPGYVRTRFNLGVACYNLRAYRESVEHYLSALNLQKNSQGPTETTSSAVRQMSETIWTSLKLSLSLLGRAELLPICAAHQLDDLNREFNMAS